MPTTVITIAGTAYPAAARCAAGFNAIDQLTLSLDEGYDTLAFTLEGIGPRPPFAVGVSCACTIDGTRRFAGEVLTYQQHQTKAGWAFTFTADGLQRSADRVSITGRDGSGFAVYNRPPSDGAWYVPSLAGMSAGAVVADLLTIPANAAALSAEGVGNYVTLTPPTLPAATVSDLGGVTFVPSGTVRLSGQNFFTTLREFIRQWDPRFALWIDPADGTIRCVNLFAIGTTRSLVVPGEASGADPVTWPEINVDVSNCYAAVEFVGVFVTWAYLSTFNGTLTERVATATASTAAWSLANQNLWTLNTYQSTGDAQDAGTPSSITSSSCVVTSNDSTRNWPTNFWDANDREGWIALTYGSGTGINMQESRQITACTSLSAGGTATIQWDASNPLGSTTYDSYQIMGTAGGVDDVGRLFLVREPATGHTGVATFLGQNLEPAFPTPVAIGIHSTAFLATTAVAWVVGSAGGITFSWPMTIEIVPQLGGIRFTEPVVKPTASSFQLQAGYPTTVAAGLPQDVQVIVPYNRGGLTARYPSSGLAGTANSVYGVIRVWVIPLENFTYPAQATTLGQLAQQVHTTVCDAVIEGSIAFHGYPSAFDPLAFPYNLSLSIAGVTGGAAPDWAGVNLPMRQARVTWPQGSGEGWRVAFRFSNRRTPYQNYDSFIHPMTQQGQKQGQSPFENPIVGIPPALASGVAGNFGAAGTVDGMGVGAGGPMVSTPPSVSAAEATGRGRPSATSRPSGSRTLAPLVGPEPPGGTPALAPSPPAGVAADDPLADMKTGDLAMDRAIDAAFGDES